MSDFEIVQPGDEEVLWNFLKCNFVSDAPVMRSCGLYEEDTWLDRKLQNIAKNSLLNQGFQEPHSIMIKDEAGEIMGIENMFVTVDF